MPVVVPLARLFNGLVWECSLSSNHSEFLAVKMKKVIPWLSGGIEFLFCFFGVFYYLKFFGLPFSGLFTHRVPYGRFQSSSKALGCLWDESCNGNEVVEYSF